MTREKLAPAGARLTLNIVPIWTMFKFGIGKAGMPRVATKHHDDIVPGPPHLELDRFNPTHRRRLSGPGLRTFLTIADLWGLNEEQRRLILGLPSRSTFQNWAKLAREHRDVTLDVDVLTRISAVLGIHQSLILLHGTEAEGIAWLRGPHRATVFGGRPPLELVTSGTQDALLTVRRFLDAARGGVYMAPNEIDTAFHPYNDSDIVFV
jgi:hypothetical protein